MTFKKLSTLLLSSSMIFTATAGSVLTAVVTNISASAGGDEEVVAEDGKTEEDAITTAANLVKALGDGNAAISEEDTGYETNKTVKLLKPVTLDHSLYINIKEKASEPSEGKVPSMYDLTLDLNGNDLTFTGEDSRLILMSDNSQRFRIADLSNSGTAGTIKSETLKSGLCLISAGVAKVQPAGKLILWISDVNITNHSLLESDGCSYGIGLFGRNSLNLAGYAGDAPHIKADIAIATNGQYTYNTETISNPDSEYSPSTLEGAGIDVYSGIIEGNLCGVYLPAGSMDLGGENLLEIVYPPTKYQKNSNLIISGEIGVLVRGGNLTGSYGCFISTGTEKKYSIGDALDDQGKLYNVEPAAIVFDQANGYKGYEDSYVAIDGMLLSGKNDFLVTKNGSTDGNIENNHSLYVNSGYFTEPVADEYFTRKSGDDLYTSKDITLLAYYDEDKETYYYGYSTAAEEFTPEWFSKSSEGSYFIPADVFSKKDAEKYTVKLEEDGGTIAGPSEYETLPEGSQIMLPEGTKSGSTIQSYKAKNGKTYAPGSIYTLTKDDAERGTIILTPTWKSTGGGSFSGGGNSSSINNNQNNNENNQNNPSTPSTVTNPDGSTTTTTEDPDTGVKTEVTTGKDNEYTTTTVTQPDGSSKSDTVYEDGTKQTVEKAVDQSTKTTITQPDETTTTTTADASGNLTSASANVSNQAVDNAKAENKAVQLVMPQIPADQKDEGVAVEVSLPSQGEETTIAIPVNNANPGSVAMIEVDGQLQPITDSMVDESGNLIVPLTGSARIVIKDNSKDFPDMPNLNKTTYPGSGIAFLSSREIMTGEENGNFSPTKEVSRGMLARMLYNLEGSPDVSGKQVPAGVGEGYYKDAATWVADKGLMAQGSNFRGEDNLTREQLAMILWRYSDKPAPQGDLSKYTAADQASISSPEMQKAVSWAVGEKIMGQGSPINGQNDGSREQIANMLYRFLAKVS